MCNGVLRFSIRALKHLLNFVNVKMKMHDYAFDYCEHYFFFENYMILIIIDPTKFDV